MKLFYLFSSFSIIILCLGCSENEFSEIDAANERIRALEKNIETLNEEIERRKSQLQEQEKYYEDRIRRINYDHQQRIGELENTISEQTIEISNLKRVVYAERAAEEHPDIIDDIQKRNLGVERVVWICLIFINMGISLLFALKYFNIRRQRRENIAQIVSELTKPGRVDDGN